MEGTVDAAVAGLLRRVWDLPPTKLTAIVEVARAVLRAETVKVLVVDYGLVSLRALGDDGPVDEVQSIVGTLAGRALSHGETVTVGTNPTMVYVPLTEGAERVGVLEIAHNSWDEDFAALAGPVAQVLVLLLISRRRYTDAVQRSRRSQSLSTAAEMQWGLLPPLACAGDGVALSGILEPAYSIGGDSFDYALDPDGVQFAIIDAVGHGLPALLLSVTTINGLRNARREKRSISDAYAAAGALLETNFGDSAYVTGQIGTLDVRSGRLSWINAGHPQPLLVRDGHARALACAPSWPMGLGGTVTEIGSEDLQPGDTVLFYTDGAVDSRSPTGEPFGIPRLIDHLVVAVQAGVAPAETVRRLSSSIVEYNGAELTDDATLLLLEYHGAP
ncbi:MAG TPA: PP2C family protein-serine/threonine phosphatase [Acidimicrobiales bacterium]|nr:PP2C family protein-serine/threonine phosphatase [Acidimicrobiales bacterium]